MRGRDAELVVQADLGDAVDVAQALRQFEVRMALQAALEGGDDLAARKARAARPAHGQDEGPAEARVVGGVELLDVRKLGGRAVGQAGPALFVRALGGQALADHRLAGQFGVGAHQGHLPFAPGFAHAGGQRVLQRGQRGQPAAGAGQASRRTQGECS
jgi:hypothetical protein